MTATIPLPHNTRTAQCARCGVVRQVNANKTRPLCRDCRGVLTAAEREVWA